MIVIDRETPRWIRELERFIHIKSLLLVHGNVLDLVSFPVSRGDGDGVYWTEGELSGFFNRFLIGLGYEIVGSFDPVSGLCFADNDMSGRYQALTGSRVADPATPARPARAGRNDDNGLIDGNTVMDGINAAVKNRETPCAFVFHFSSRLLDSPDHLSRQERALFTRVLKASLSAKEVLREEQRWSNVIILVCDKINDLPVFLYLNNPRARSIHLQSPDQQERIRYFQSTYRSFHHSEGERPSADLCAQFGAFTEGFSYYEMMSLVGLSRRERIPIADLQKLVERFKYGIVESAWDKVDKTRLDQACDFFYGRIKGQDNAVERVLSIIKRAKLGLAAGSGKRNQRPRGVLFFAGPTGVGKTEVAKGLAELLFGQRDRLVRFDMSEYAAAHADQKLLGSPPGYVGYEEGGQLTNAIKQNPFSVLLFDEIEKAHPSIFDKFLQILDDGRLTDGKGETVYFSECIIVFTSNLGTVAESNHGREVLVTPDMVYDKVRDTILGRIRDHFYFTLGRPEILNRFGDNFVVFDFIRPPADAAIVALLIEQLQTALRQERGIELVVAAQVVDSLNRLAAENLAFGGRGIRNLIDSALVNPLAAWLFDNNVEGDTSLRLNACVDQGAGALQRFVLEIERG
jgi:ATP-dependent Clp protease ATP-binding subunit ClpA